MVRILIGFFVLITSIYPHMTLAMKDEVDLEPPRKHLTKIVSTGVSNDEKDDTSILIERNIIVGLSPNKKKISICGLYCDDYNEIKRNLLNAIDKRFKEISGFEGFYFGVCRFDEKCLEDLKKELNAEKFNIWKNGNLAYKLGVFSNCYYSGHKRSSAFFKEKFGFK